MVRPKYACHSCTDGVVQAKALPRLIESGMASTALDPLAALLSPIAVSDTAPPAFDIARECRFEGESIEALDLCSKDEADALQ